MTIKWGDPIECNGVRPDWLRGRVTCDLKTAAGWGSAAYYDSENDAEDWAWSHRPGDPNVTHIRLPADHPAYVALARGFTPWSGGESAPDDWDGGDVLLRDGTEWAHYPTWTDCGTRSIIGYRKRVEYGAVDTDGSRSGDTVEVRRMTEDQWRVVIMNKSNLEKKSRATNTVISVLGDLGLIRPETTAERFTRETGHAVTEAVEAALNWKDTQA